MTENYSQSHTAPTYGARYTMTYSKGYYAAQWREVERPLLRLILGRLSTDRKSCLDFACGTGRITNVAAEFFERVVGVDISESMLEQTPVMPNAEFQCRDITRDELAEKFNVITAFRFFLKAEDDLRRRVLTTLHRHMAEDGRLVCNIHMQASSPLGLVYRAQRAITGRGHETMSHETFRALLSDCGFEIESTTFYGYAPRPGHYFSGAMEFLVPKIERIARKLRFPKSLAQCFVVVAKKA